MKDKIAKKILKMEKDKLMSEPEPDRDWEMITALEIAIEAIEDRPQGEWKLDNLGAYCSECKKYPDYTTDFCPFCGADMRGEGK